MLSKLGSLIMLVSLLGVLVALGFAQDDWQVYTSEDETLSFAYPADWYVFTQDFGGQRAIVNDIDLVNIAVANMVNNLESGQFGMSIGSIEGGNTDNVTIEGLPNYVEFDIGVLSTTLIFSAQFLNQIYGDNEPRTIYFSDYEVFEINDKPAGQIKANFGDQAYWLISVDYDGHILSFLIRSYIGEMEIYEDTVFQIIESVEYTPQTEMETNSSSQFEDIIDSGIFKADD